MHSAPELSSNGAMAGEGVKPTEVIRYVDDCFALIEEAVAWWQTNLREAYPPLTDLQYDEPLLDRFTKLGLTGP